MALAVKAAPTLDLPGIKFIDAKIDLHWPESKLHAEARHVCMKILPGWDKFEESDISVSAISGGITNILLKLAPSVGEEEPVTLRIFGENTEVLIDREAELQVINFLSDQPEFGASLLGAFSNGRLESFLHARTLQPQEMAEPGMAAAIARSLRKFHDLQVPGPKEPQLWELLDNWLRIASSITFDDPEKQARLDKTYRGRMRSELDILKRVCESLEAPVVFCHNDALSGNIMEDNKTGTLILIDFEYSMYSFRGFDIGNHFNEYAGFECNYTLYPSKDAQFHFFKHYLDKKGAPPPGESELEALFMEVAVFSLASHMYWAIWALIQAKHSPIDFDYLGYSNLRMDEHFRRKPDVLQLVEAKSRTS